MELISSEPIETRLVKSTSKRQITIPKSFYDILSLGDEVTLTAQVYGGLIVMKPNRA